MLSNIRIFFILTFCLCGKSVLAQLSLNGQYIPRSEFRHGYKNLPTSSQDDAFFIVQRTRLVLGYDNPKYNFGLAVQDIRTWGSQSQLNISDELLSVHEAWGEVKIKEGFSLKLGRQELAYGDHRILGNVDWAMQARSHDLALFKLEKEKMKLHFGAAFNQDKEQLTTNLYTVTNNYKAMQFVWLNTSLGEKVKSSFLALNNGVQLLAADSPDNKDDTKYSQTIGNRTVFKGESIRIIGSFYLQTGKIGILDLSASNLALELTYKGIKSLSLTPGFELLSGSSQTNASNTKNNSFNPLYGTNHKFNGFMDYFYVGNQINSVGLKDLYFKIGYKMERSKLLVDTHFFLSEEDILDNAEFNSTGNVTAMDDYLGTEIDITYNVIYSPDMSLHFGYSQMFGTNSLVELRGGDKNTTSNWAYIMLKLKPDFLKKKEGE